MGASLVALLWMLLLQSAASATHPDIPPLLALRNALSPPLLWPSNADSPCDWPGVVCTTTTTTSESCVSALHLQNLGLHGHLPAHLATSLPHLRHLNLSSNLLVGNLRLFFPLRRPLIPLFPSLTILDLSHNFLSGPLPPSLAFCPSLEEIYLSHNFFSGSIPPSLGSLPNLLSLSLSDNVFVGSLPTSISRCKKLQFLDVSNNNLLSGSLPSLPHLRFFNASHTLIQDQDIPANQWFLHVDASFVDGRIAAPPKASPTHLHWATRFASLFDFSFFKSFRKPSNRRRRALDLPKAVTASSPSFAPAAAPAVIPQPEKEPSAVSGIVKFFTGSAIGICAGGISALLGLFLLRMFIQYCRRTKPNMPTIFQHRIIKLKSLAFLQKEDGLEGTELLGAGGSGKVFKSILDDGRVVAIKKVIPVTSECIQKVDANMDESYYDILTKHTKQIQAELHTLAKVRHRNLVTLLAYVPRADAHLLIYDFMENGSLHDALRKVSDGLLNLTWPMRHKIAVGAAKGLKYLHTDCSPRIIHCDLKPGNILLDQDFEAHLGDFGLAKLLADTDTHCTSANIAGTVGYIAPEYYNTLRYSTKGDVYSFGVVLTVLLTGKEPTDHLFSGVYTHMGNWIVDCLTSGREKATKCFDENLRGQGYEEEMFLALKVAAFCVDGSAAARPTINDVLIMLMQIRQ